MQVQRSLSEGEVVLRETPIAIVRADALHEACISDPVLRSYVMRAGADESPWDDYQWWPAAKVASSEVIERFATLEFARLGSRQQQRWMSLVDSFSTPPAKSPGNILRSNAFTQPATGDNYLFELLSRANHCCRPNMRRSFAGEVAVVTTTRAVAAGEELLLSYLSDSDLQRSTEERRALLRDKFNFVCECERCGPCPPLAAADRADPGCGPFPPRTAAAGETDPVVAVETVDSLCERCGPCAMRAAEMAPSVLEADPSVAAAGVDGTAVCSGTTMERSDDLDVSAVTAAALTVLRRHLQVLISMQSCNV